MCGLAGILTSETRTREELARCGTGMGASLIHRGPDDEGLWLDAEEGVVLVFRRLAIVDLTQEGHQPMTSASGRFMMVFNGEVYNHVELSRELEQKGVRFRGHSDTEVILAAFEAWGIEAAVRRFVGMFAIGVWDRRERQLHLIRDRLGIKPMFVYWKDGQLLFGSELKALMAHPDFAAQVDRSALAAYLRYLYVPAPLSILKGVKKLSPGHILTISDVRAAPPESRAYWSAQEVAERGRRERFQGSDSELIDELHRILTDAVALRMRADVPVGAFLSGGIDSSLVVALMQACNPTPVRTFTIGFDEPEWNEAEYAAQIAKHLGTSHTSVTLTAQDALALIPGLPHTFDEPLADPSQIPTYLVSQIARRDVTVSLSGDGGDELFAGYNRYTRGVSTIRRANRVPRPFRVGIARALHSRTPAAWDVTMDRLGMGVRLAGDKLHKLGDLLVRDGEADMYRSLLSQWHDPERILLDAIEPPDVVERIMNTTSGLSLLDRMMLSDQMGYLPDDLLAKVDRASMAVSLEARVPLLDHRVVEFSWRVPDRLRVKDGQSKWPLRRVLERYVPREQFERPKMGFSVPVDRWLRGPLRDWADDLLDPATLRRDGIFDVPTVTQAWSAVRSGRSRAGMALWAVLVFQAWQAHWLQNPAHIENTPALAVAG
ncbi:MAG: asparagine synthase (glutamine-hydrolyzing) [Gemmatimonadota bacterium]